MDPIREAIQGALDRCQDGWSVTTYAVAVFLERVADDEIEKEPWLIVPPHQPACDTRSVMREACELEPSAEGVDTTE